MITLIICIMLLMCLGLVILAFASSIVWLLPIAVCIVLAIKLVKAIIKLIETKQKGKQKMVIMTEDELNKNYVRRESTTT